MATAGTDGVDPAAAGTTAADAARATRTTVPVGTPRRMNARQTDPIATIASPFHARCGKPTREPGAETQPGSASA